MLRRCIYFLLVSLMLCCITLPAIRTLQPTGSTDDENSRKELGKSHQPNKQDGLRTEIKAEIGKIADEIEQLQKGTSELDQNLVDNTMDKNRRALTKNDELRATKRVLVQLRDYVYYVEGICLNSIEKTNSTPATSTDLSTSPLNHTRHYYRWMLFSKKCYRVEFLTVKIKIHESMDWAVFSEQIDVLMSLTGSSIPVHLSNQWYKKSRYLKGTLIQTMKKHTTLDENFIKFFDIMYDLVVDFNERWKTIK